MCIEMATEKKRLPQLFGVCVCSMLKQNADSTPKAILKACYFCDDGFLCCFGAALLVVQLIELS